VKGEATNSAAPSEIRLSEIIRLVDGPLSPFGDAEQRRSLIASDAAHRRLYWVFLDVRYAAVHILESTKLADIIGDQEAPKTGTARTAGAFYST